MTISEVRMDRRIRGLLAAVAALGLFAAACAEDPLSGLDGSPAGVRTDVAFVTVDVGDTVYVVASVIDGRSIPLTTEVAFAACDASITVAADASYDPYPKTAFRAIVVGVSAGTTCVNATGGGQSAEVDVEVQ
jgi:hypothetical protein